MSTHRLVVDIETICGQNHEDAMAPFIEGLIGKKKRVTKKEATDLKSFLADDDGDKYVDALKRCVLSPVGGRVACIGVLEINATTFNTLIPDEDRWHFIYSPNEKEMIEKFAKLIKPQTELITFNGREFDFPFLMFRASILGIDLKLDIKPYNGENFRGNNHYDLKQHLEQISCVSNLSGDWSVTKVGLKKWIEYFGWGSKLSIKDGEISIDKLIEDGNLAELEEYSKNDVMKTYELWKKFQGNFV